jgi:hypothetical protein
MAHNKEEKLRTGGVGYSFWEAGGFYRWFTVLQKCKTLTLFLDKNSTNFVNCKFLWY